jgi:hypothetical protein
MALLGWFPSQVVPTRADSPPTDKAAERRSALDRSQNGETNAVATQSEKEKPVTERTKGKEEPLPREVLSGKVVLLQDALKSRGVKAYAEMKEQAVLETDAGELIPLVSDWRGRALFQDERLRDRKVDLVGMRRPGIPYFQVLMIFTFDEQGERQYMDYWCDICSIPMYEIKPCDCCQADIRLRFQPRDLPEYVRRPQGDPRKNSDPDKPH